MLLMVCVGACWPFTCVMVVGEGCSGWCVFQWCVAVVPPSRRVPGVGVCVSWLVLGACLGVGWLVCVLWWFRVLMCVRLFPCLFVLVLFVCLVNNAAWAGVAVVSWFVGCGVRGVVASGGVCLVWGAFWVCVVIGLLILVLLVCTLVRVCVW